MTQDTTRENLQTTEIFRPSRWQVLGSVYYVPRPKRRLSWKKALAILIVVSGLTYAITYALVRGLG